MNSTFRQRYRRKDDFSEYLAIMHSQKALQDVPTRIKANNEISKNRIKYSHRETFGKGDVDELGWPD